MKILYHHRTRSMDGQNVHNEETIRAPRKPGHEVIVVAPLKLFECLALGRAIIGPAQSKLMEILTDGQNAVLFKPKAADGMAGATSKLTLDIALRQRPGGYAKKTIGDKQPTWRENAVRAVELFKRIPRNA